MKEMTLLDMFRSHTGRQIDKWEHYFPIYEFHFQKYRGQSPRVLEIGIDHGGSLQLWKRYFGRSAEIIGVDIDSSTLFREDQITTYAYKNGQVDPEIANLGPFDIIIDDGSHKVEDQSATFANLWPRCQGVYLIEDCHGAYPMLTPNPQLLYRYPWVIVAERAKRRIVGTPSRELRPDEVEARKLYAR